MQKLTVQQCKKLCALYYKNRKRQYERGQHSVEELARHYHVSHDTVRRVINGKYRINSIPFIPKDYGFEKVVFKPSKRSMK